MVVGGGWCFGRGSSVFGGFRYLVVVNDGGGFFSQ